MRSKPSEGASKEPAALKRPLRTSPRHEIPAPSAFVRRARRAGGGERFQQVPHPSALGFGNHCMNNAERLFGHVRIAGPFVNQVANSLLAAVPMLTELKGEFCGIGCL